MREESFVTYKSMRFMRINLFLLLAMAIGYFLYSPVSGRSGANPLGLSYGIFAALAIVHLMWFAVRKRSYYRSSDTVKAWLSMHVWLGLILLFVVPLHAGFRFSWNVHTLAYILMAITISSGIWGAYMYLTLAPEVPSHRGLGTTKDLLLQINSLESEISKLSNQKAIGFANLRHRIDFDYKPTIRNAVLAKVPQPLNPKIISPLLNDIPLADRAEGQRLVGIIEQKRECCLRLNKEVRTKFWLKVWLYCHVPLALVMCVALIIHIFAELYFF